MTLDAVRPLGLLRALGPRHLRPARRWAAAFTAVGALVTAIFAVLAPGPLSMFSPEVIVSVSMLLLVAGLLLLSEPKAAALCVLTPLLGVFCIAFLDVATQDASAAAQIFFCLPVLFAATQLRSAGATLVTASAVAGHAVVTLSVLPFQKGLTDLVYVGTTLALTAGLLSRAGVTNDRLISRLRQQAAIDPLTGLVTRRVLDDACRAAISSAGLRSGTALILMDVDLFKSVNDTHGHPVGDDALSHIAVVLAEHSRPNDVIARMGGDEIAVLLPGCTHGVALRRAEEFVAAVRDTPLILSSGLSLQLSVSAGVAHATDAGGEVRELYAAADAALYVAKHAGRGRVGQVPEPDGPTLAASA
jgi:diguanylate cyclase (GGDEF)-like protein